LRNIHHELPVDISVNNSDGKIKSEWLALMIPAGTSIQKCILLAKVLLHTFLPEKPRNKSYALTLLVHYFSIATFVGTFN